MEKNIFIYKNETIDSIGVIIANDKESAVKRASEHFKVEGAPDMEFSIYSWDEWKSRENYDFPDFEDMIEIAC